MLGISFLLDAYVHTYLFEYDHNLWIHQTYKKQTDRVTEYTKREAVWCMYFYVLPLLACTTKR